MIMSFVGSNHAEAVASRIIETARHNDEQVAVRTIHLVGCFEAITIDPKVVLAALAQRSSGRARWVAVAELAELGVDDVTIRRLLENGSGRSPSPSSLPDVALVAVPGFDREEFD